MGSDIDTRKAEAVMEDECVICGDPVMVDCAFCPECWLDQDTPLEGDNG